VNMVFNLIRHASNYKDTFTSAQRRAAKRAAIVSLQDHSIEQADAIAELVILLGIHDEVESWELLLRLSNATEVLGLVYEVISVKEQNLNIGIAVSKAAKILFALKKYSHQGNEEHATEFDVVDNLETVLAIYSNNLKQVEVIKSFEPVHKIMGYPDELNQVWTNLIHNSLQAMDGKGKMEFKIYSHPTGGIVTEITDFGQGIPEENLKKIFDPFFTTKVSGEGTGLGLSIVKKIIDKHEGKIECESVVGHGTTFRVMLPN
jgi:two-component system, NtrC family, sensor kinase